MKRTNWAKIATNVITVLILLCAIFALLLLLRTIIGALL